MAGILDKISSLKGGSSIKNLKVVNKILENMPPEFWPKENLSNESVASMLRDKGFFDSNYNDSASGFPNDYKLQNEVKVILDSASSLMWQQSGADTKMNYEYTNAYITKLNSDQFAGYNDWRLPTLEEAMSLMEPTQKNGKLYIDPMFDEEQNRVWTSDQYSATRAWVANFSGGTCESGALVYGNSVRAVRYVSSPSVQNNENLNEHIDRLWEDAKKLGWSDVEQQKAIDIYTEILTLVDEQSTENDVCAFLRNRAIAYRFLNNFDAALEDHARELEIAQGRGDHMRIIKCSNLIEEAKERKREVQIEAEGGDKAARLHATEVLGHRLWHDGPEFETAFGSLFADMENRDPDVRFDASRLLAKNRDALQRLVTIYQECVNSDPGRASLAGRVLGRQFRSDIIMTNAETTQRMYGISASFIHCPCVHCNHRNRGIAAPPNSSTECFYTQRDDKGAYAVPVLCDRCSKKFFVVWDSDPR